MPGTVLQSGDTEVIKMEKGPALVCNYILLQERDNQGTYIINKSDNWKLWVSTKNTRNGFLFSFCSFLENDWTHHIAWEIDIF